MNSEKPRALTPMSAEEIDRPAVEGGLSLRQSIELRRGGVARAVALRLLATVDARDEEIARARKKIEQLAASRSSLDCRFAGPDLWESSGSHCLFEDPCARCSADRRQEAAERDAERFKAALENVIACASVKTCHLTARAALSERAP